MPAARDELHHLVEQLSEDQVPAALRELQRLASEPKTSTWPPPWFGSIAAGRSDTSESVDEILAEGFGRRAVIVCDTLPVRRPAELETVS